MNVLVLSLPGLRLSHLGCYGNEWVATPTLDRLAVQGVVFDHHYAECPGVAVALRPEWSGRHYHFMPEPATDIPLPDTARFPELLRKHGVATCLIEAKSTQVSMSPWEQVFEQILDQVETMGGSSAWCVWAEGPSLAPPWELPEEILASYFDEGEEELPWANPSIGWLSDDDEAYLRLQRTYAAVVTHVDLVLSELLEELESLPSYQETLFILTSDQGVALGEHGVVGPHRPWLHDEIVHLPLLMRLPRSAEAGRRVAAITQPIDLHATILDAFGLPTAGSRGISLLHLARGEITATRDIACSSMRVDEALEWSLRTSKWAFLLPLQLVTDDQPRPPQLYAKPEDAWEENDVRQQNLDFAEELEQRLRSYMATVAQGEESERNQAEQGERL
jgi:arylsulfatase A-like enzyme